jgi:hypothetical protein
VIELRDSDESLAAALIRLPGVVGVLLGGSRATGTADSGSDTDLYAFHVGAVSPAGDRAAALGSVADHGGVREETAWGPEDHFTVAGSLVEVVHLDLDAMSADVDRAYSTGLDDEGFATAFLHTVDVGHILRDPTGRLSAMRARLDTYPGATRARLLATLPSIGAAYLGQLTKAASRGDLTMVQHRRAGIQTIYFNLLFTINRRYHPGEKRLLEHGERCPIRPANQTARWVEICRMPADDVRLPSCLDSLMADLTSLGNPPSGRHHGTQG